MSRAFERMEGESSKAYAGFQVYRDLGPGRSLVKAAELYYGSAANVRQMSRWSSRFDWGARAQAFDDWAAMIGREAVEGHIQALAQDHARREAAIREGALEVREEALAQAKKMLAWPISEQRAVTTDEDGSEVTYVFMPAKWNKSTAATMFNMAIQGVSEVDPDELGVEEDYSEMSEEELQELLRLTGKVCYKPPE